MKEDYRFTRPTLRQDIKSRLEAICEGLLSLSVQDVTWIVISALSTWALSLSLDQVQNLVNNHLPRPHETKYEKYVNLHHRRFYTMNYFAELLMWSEPIHRTRSPLKGWIALNPNQHEEKSSRILNAMVDLETNDAFDFILELTLTWTDRYNRTMALEYASQMGRRNLDEWTDENVTAFLRLMFHREISMTDNRTADNLDPWKD